MPMTVMRKAINTMDNGPSPEPPAPEGARPSGLTGAPVEPAAERTGPAGPEAGETAPAGPGPGLRASLEAILLVADEPVPEIVIAQVVERPTEEVSAALRELAAAYAGEGRGFELSEVAGGWRFYTSADCAAVVERFVRDGQEVRLTQAALETLAVVAYRQPVSRARVSAVRGVNCDGVMRTLVLRGLVEEGGTDPDTGAILFRTTGYFLERLGLPALADLPELAPFLPDQIDDELDAREAGHENVRS
jgi:segregation and condensation protein B